MATFRTTLRQSGKEATGIEIPPEVIKSLDAGKVPPVALTVNGYAYRSTVAVVGGQYMVGFNADHRAASGIKAGDVFDVEIHVDREPRTVEVPADLAAALDAEPRARATFEQISNSNKRWHVAPVTGAKTADTRQRRIDKSIAMLRDGRAR
jgi:hypothetical protein